jgi:SAM-dependent methyltransferase
VPFDRLPGGRSARWRCFFVTGALGEILSQLAGSERPLRVVDLGSGIGLSTRLWRGFEATVIGIEPSPDMRVIAERLQAIDEGQSNISFEEGTSTNNGLAKGCADIATVSQALHWMEAEPTFSEIARILRARGFSQPSIAIGRPPFIQIRNGLTANA